MNKWLNQWAINIQVMYLRYQLNPEKLSTCGIKIFPIP